MKEREKAACATAARAGVHRWLGCQCGGAVELVGAHGLVGVYRCGRCERQYVGLAALEVRRPEH